MNPFCFECTLGILPCLCRKAKWVQLNGKTLHVLKKSLIAGAASKLGAAATKKKGGLASRLSKMQKDASFGPTSSLGVCNLAEFDEENH